MFITFEGPEGCGKTTHAAELKEYLEEKGHEVILTHEPGGTALGKKIRDLLLHSDEGLDQMTELCLFAADRAEHVSKIILPALKAGKIVISDRFIDSTTAYQIGGRNLARDMVGDLNLVSCQGLAPDITFLLDISSEEGLKRAQVKGAADRFEKEKTEFHKRVQEKYLEIAKKERERVKVINTEKDGIDKVQDKIRKLMDEKLRDQG